MTRNAGRGDPPPAPETQQGRDGGDGEPPSDAEETTLLRGLFLDEAQVHLRAIADAQRWLARASDDKATFAAAEALLRCLHTLKGAAGSVGLEAVGRAAHELEGLCDEIRAGSLAPTPGILERIDESVAGLRALLDGARAAPPSAERRFSAPSVDPLDDHPERRRLPDRRRGFERRSGGDRSLRVESARLDALLDGVGDLVILRTRIERRLRELEGVSRDLNDARAALRQALVHAGDAPPDGAVLSALLDRLSESELAFSNAAAHLDRATRALGSETEALRRTSAELDEELRRARMIPLDWAFQRLPHALRELERSTGRPADLMIQGGDVEVDKGLAEQMAEALLHLLRNAVAHGLEPPSERALAGKPERGRLEVSARQEGEFVFIEFADDGRGIDREAVRQALLRRGRTSTNAALGDRALLAAIFEPGFSSRAAVDSLAGRGMGLDIVKRSVIRLGGDITVEHAPGAGTRFRLTVPLHAAITEAVLFKVGGQVFGVPAAHVTQAVPLGPDALLVNEGRREGLAARASERLPILRLQSLLGVEMPPGKRAAALQIRYGERGFIVTCDKIIGPRTIVVRPLGPVLGVLSLYAGVTISGAGKAQLVFDLGALSDAAHAPMRPNAPGVRRAQPRVLVADDSRLQRETTARLLIAAGLQAITAEDGWEAWELLGEQRFDALVTDLEMPRLDGFELIERIRREPTLKELPIVVLSSRAAQAPRDRALAAGANAVFPKGPHKKALLEMVTGLIAARRTGPA